MAATLVRVPAEDLPGPARALLDPGVPRPAGSRFLPRRTRHIAPPAAWLVALLVIGIVSLRLTLASGLDPGAGDARLLYGGVAAVCLVGALFSAGKLLQGIAERRGIHRGTYRRGLHVLGREGLLIAGGDEHTWVPRASLPTAEARRASSGGDHVASYAFVIVDDRQREERLECGGATMSALSMWAQHGQLPDGGGWR